MKSLEKLWDLLGNDLSLLFGRECASATIWMFWCLLLRLILLIIRLDSYFALGIVFACPVFIQIMLQCIPIFQNSIPILPVRLGESLLGRLSMSKLLVVIPAHFLGSILGAVFIHAIHPPYAAEALKPIYYQQNNYVVSICLEATLAALYVSLVIVLPVIIEVNRLPKELLSLIMFPLLLVKVCGMTVTFNPAVNFALWYVSGSTPTGNLQLDHILGPILGGLLGGLLCVRYFPDDPTSFKRKTVEY